MLITTESFVSNRIATIFILIFRIKTLRNALLEVLVSAKILATYAASVLQQLFKSNRVDAGTGLPVPRQVAHDLFVQVDFFVAKKIQYCGDSDHFTDTREVVPDAD